MLIIILLRNLSAVLLVFTVVVVEEEEDTGHQSGWKIMIYPGPATAPAISLHLYCGKYSKSSDPRIAVENGEHCPNLFHTSPAL